jgi:hypothetical protein
MEGLMGKEEMMMALTSIGQALSGKVSAFLIGGGAMALRGEKVATKDVDVILLSDSDLDTFKKAIVNEGFNHANQIPRGCEALSDADIFQKDAKGVCNGMTLS